MGLCRLFGESCHSPSIRRFWCFNESLAAVRVDEKWGFIDKTGHLLIPLQYDYAWNFKEDVAAVKQNGKWGFIDKAGQEFLPFLYDEADSFSKGFAEVKMDTLWGVIDKTGTWVKNEDCI